LQQVLQEMDVSGSYNYTKENFGTWGFLSYTSHQPA
jgi:hypothetical protein